MGVSPCVLFKKADLDYLYELINLYLEL